MKKTLIAALLVFCLAQAYAADSRDIFAGYPYKSASWKSKTVTDVPDGRFSFEQAVFMKNKKMRTEGEFLNRATNEKEKQVTILTNECMYSINPDKKQGMKYSLKDANNPAKNDIAMNTCRDKAKKTGSEKVNGVNCDKYEYTCDLGGTESKITEYRNSKGFPIRTLSKTGRYTTITDVTDLKVKPSIPDSKFVPDKDIKFTDMDKMMGGSLQEIMKKAASGKKGGSKDEDSGEEEQKMMKDMMKNMMGQ